MPQLDRLGLRENPFKNNTDPRYFYADQNRIQIMEATEHLIEYSSNFQVIVGESGVGKSHFLAALSARIDNNWRIATVNNAEQHDTLSLIQSILDAFGALNSANAELLEALETQLAEINQLGFKPVLMVDSAQALSLDSLRFLIQLSQQKQDDEPYINIVLFAAEEVTEALQSSELKAYRDCIHIATLNRFDKEGVSAYLRHKMAVAGYDRESPFTPRIIDSIFKDSQGLPEKINFYADKFLSSSGKAENYIQPADIDNNHEMGDSLEPMDSLEPANSPEPINSLEPTGSSEPADSFALEDSLEAELNKQIDEFSAELNDLQDKDLEVDRSDRAGEQLSRLAEKFEEIEQLGEQPDDAFLDKDSHEDLFTEKPAASSSGLPKFIIPAAVIGLLIVAVLVINSVFEKSENTSGAQPEQEEIELLPLDLPPQASIKIPTVAQPEKNPAVAGKPVAETQPSTEQSLSATSTTQEKPAKLEIIQTQTEPVAEAVVLSELKEVAEPVVAVKASVSLSRIEPEPVIGSNSRQYLTIIGNNLQKTTILVVSWADNKKDFSAKLTPKQWRYVNNRKIKLHLSTGITPQQWQIIARNDDGAQSQPVSFDVVKPFIAKMAIKHISPDPFIGSDKRQAVTIAGQGFSKQTVIELKWGKNKKHFSARLTPDQFKFVSAGEVKLFIATGTRERVWRVKASNPDGKTSSASFSVLKTRPLKAPAEPPQSGLIKGQNWLQQQPDNNYTIQLFASHNKQAIDDLIKKYSLQGDILRFETQRNGQSWFTMTYGSYSSKQAAQQAMSLLAPQLKNPTPWVRSMASIKNTLKTAAVKTAAKPEQTAVLQTAGVASRPAVKSVKDQAWIWTQSPADYTIQLIALSSEQAVKDYIKQHNLYTEAVYFSTPRNGKTLFVLLYGSYEDKNRALAVSKKLAAKIKNAKPWVRSFSTVHGMMDSR